MAFVVVIDGDSQRRVALTGDLVTIGRGAGCDLVLAGDESVSRQHARLERTAGGWTVTDLGSRNGTHLNGRRLGAATEVAHDDRLRVGSFVLLVRSDDEENLETTDESSRNGHRPRTDTGLSARELDVVRLVFAGLTDQAIADELFVSIKTVHSHLDRIGQKTGHRRRQELVRFAIEHGLA